MTAFALADEPGWSFPDSAPETFYPAIKAEWESFLRAQNLTPGDFGASSWDGVAPNSSRWGGVAGPQWGLGGPPARLRYYYTARFSALSSARAFANATAALQQSFYSVRCCFNQHYHSTSDNALMQMNVLHLRESLSDSGPPRVHQHEQLRRKKLHADSHEEPELSDAEPGLV